MRLRAGAGAPGALLVRLQHASLSSWRARILTAALFLWLLDALLGLVGRRLPGLVSVPVRIVLWVAVAWLLWRLFRRLAERLLWRIRTKLILSYLFIALVPVVLMTAFTTIAGVLLLGLVGSRMLTDEIDSTAAVLRAAASSVVVELPPEDALAARALPVRLAPLAALHPRLGYALVRRGRLVASSGRAPQQLPQWLSKQASFGGLVTPAAGEPSAADVLRAAALASGSALLLEVPVDGSFYDAIEGRTGIHVIRAGDAGGARAAARGGGFQAFASPERSDWASGERSAARSLPLVFRYRPMDVVRRLSPVSVREFGMSTMPEFLLYLLGILAAAFVALYGFALALGLLLARQITRGVHELSLGTERLRQGDFSHTIRARSRDQLGDLADSFNGMSRSLKELMQEQAERQRLEEELRIARQIQMSLLPGEGVVRLPGVEVAALCLPAAEVGGDYYDLLPLGESRLGVLIADVSGKGTSAALYMAELKGLVLSLSRIHDSPARLLVEANRILAANTDSRTFVTMTYAVVDTKARLMRYARAGHNPLIQLQARTRSTRVLTPAGLGLGLDPGERFEQILEEAELPLEPGDVFLFFTDGLSEAMNDEGELFGEERLRQLLEGGDGIESEQMKERIMAAVKGFVGSAAPHDDMTLVLLKVAPEPPSPAAAGVSA